MIFLWRNKVPSGALQFTVFISVLIALLLGGMILLAYTHRFFTQQSRGIIDNIHMANTGTAALARQYNISTDTVAFALPIADDNQKLRTHLSLWGFYEKGFSEATHRRKRFTKCSLLGTVLPRAERPAIYLQDTYIPLAVVGNTKISGDVFLPAQGVNTGNISGNSYYGGQMVEGTVKKSDTLLPRLKHDYHQIINSYINEYVPSTSLAISLAGEKQVFNSFTKPVKGYFNENPVILENISVCGNIIIRSSQKITVRKSAVLRDIILAAPVIVIEDGVTGNFQAFASTSIKVGQNCQLQYPSVLAVTHDTNSPNGSYDQNTNAIFIAGNTSVKGSICYLESAKEDDYKVNIFVAPDAKVTGEIYCEGNTEFRGTLTGTVYTKHFIVNEQGTTYVNHLYNATISPNGLPDHFGGILFNKPAKKSIAKWLY